MGTSWFAHGFQVLSEYADFEYKCTDYYDPDDEGIIHWNDPTLNISWPINDPVVSKKDSQAPFSFRYKIMKLLVLGSSGQLGSCLRDQNLTMIMNIFFLIESILTLGIDNVKKKLQK